MLMLCFSGLIFFIVCVRGFFWFDRGFVCINNFLLVLDDEIFFFGDLFVIFLIFWMVLIFFGIYFVFWLKFLYYFWYVMVGVSVFGLVYFFYDCMLLILCLCIWFFCLDNSVWCINDINCYCSFVLFFWNYRMYMLFFKFKWVLCIFFVNLNIIFKII